MNSLRHWYLCLLCAAFLTSSIAIGKVVEYDLIVEEKSLAPAGKSMRVLTVNGGIPGPVLRFREGDWARIRVHNRLEKESTSIHWHGMLLPVEQDGVPEVTTPSILPGTTYTFEFPILQSGTYWYHSHTHLQEQLGVYGSIVILPSQGDQLHADIDHVVQMSDWTNEHPHKVMRSLMRGDEYYAVKKGNQQSLLGSMKDGAVREYLSNQWHRMMPMDISDVAYDAFLINGKRRSELDVKPGQRVRLRLINSGSSTYFYVESATGKMTIVAADGMPVQPVEVKRLLMGMAETYDVLVTLPKQGGSWELRATAQDGSGHASLFLGINGEVHEAPQIPKPDLYHMEHMLDAALADAKEAKAMQNMERPIAPYGLLKSTKPTRLKGKYRVRTIPLRLTGDMERYQWSINGKTMAEDGLIVVKKGEVLRFELINDTMMHHPMHLHGHFFRLVNGQGDYSPLKHTVDVPPMGKATIEFEASEVGDWLFHCHLLYHMMSGMSRIVSYQEELPDSVQQARERYMKFTGEMEFTDHHHHHGGGKVITESNGIREVNLGEHAVEPWGLWGVASVQSHMTEGLIDLRRRHDDFYLSWEVGWQDVENDNAEYELDLWYERYLNLNTRVFGGMRFTNEHEAEHRGIFGARYRLPLFIWASGLVDTEGHFELALEKELQLTSRLTMFGEVSYDTHTEWEWSVGAIYLLNKRFSLMAQHHSEFGLGGGLLIRF